MWEVRGEIIDLRKLAVLLLLTFFDKFKNIEKSSYSNDHFSYQILLFRVEVKHDIR